MKNSNKKSERLKENAYMRVYHEADDDGEHYYWFLDGNKRIDLDWGETGFIPNPGDRFPHPKRNIELRLDCVVSAASDP